MDRFRLLFVLLVFVFIFLFTPKLVQAGCGGSATCGTFNFTGHCSISTGTSCLNSNACPPGESCITTSSCTDPYPGSCDFSGAVQSSCQPNCPSCYINNGCYVTSPPPSCTSDGACKPSNQSCCSGSSYSDPSCSTGIKCGTQTSTGGASCGSCSDYCAGSAECSGAGGVTVGSRCSGGSCSAGTAPCLICAGGGGGGGGGGGSPNLSCGSACSSDSDCRNPSPAGVATACRFDPSKGYLTCQNLACWSSGGTTIDGANCDCNGYRQCGQTCGASVGVNCQNNSTCSFVQSTGFNNVAWSSTTYCVGQDATINTESVNPAYARTPGTTYYKTTPNLNYNTLDCGGSTPMGVACLAQIDPSTRTAIKTSGFSAAEIANTCACVPPDSITNPLKVQDNSRILDGATVNALQTFNVVNPGDLSQTFSTPTYSVTFRWDTGPGQIGSYGSVSENLISSTSYDIEIVPEGKDCSDPSAYCLYNTSIRYHIYTFAPKVTKYQARIRVYDARCNLAGPWTPWNHFTVTGLPPSGTVYLDSNFTSTYNAAAGSCIAANTPGGRLEIVGAPGLYGQYFNGVPYLTNTARTRYDTNVRFQSYHSFLAMPGTQDGGGESGRWTAKIRPTSSGGYNFKAYLEHLDPPGVGYNVFINNKLIWSGVYSWPVSWGGPESWRVWVCDQAAGGFDGCANVFLQKDVVYDLRIETFTTNYNSEFVMEYVNFWRTDADTGILTGSGTKVNSSEGSSNYSPVDVNASGQYSLNEAYSGGGVLTLNPSDATYKCTCPAGCTYSGVTSPVFSRDFFVTKVPDAWFQALGGNLITNGTITSKPPSGVKLILDGAGGFPGDALYGGAISPTGANISSKGWNGKSTYQAKTFDYAYFNALIPGSATLNSLGTVAAQADFDTGTAYHNYYWYKATGNNGDLIINSDIVISGNRKIILYVPGNLTINGKINIASKGQGFFMVIVGGSIGVQSSLNNGNSPALEGIFVSTGSFDTGNGNTQLYIRGSVVTYGGVSMRRNLQANNATTAAEKYEYAPDLIMLFPPDLNYSRKVFNEVIP